MQSLIVVRLAPEIVWSAMIEKDHALGNKPIPTCYPVALSALTHASADRAWYS